jgi:hypothetical protein
VVTLLIDANLLDEASDRGGRPAVPALIVAQIGHFATSPPLEASGEVAGSNETPSR